MKKTLIVLAVLVAVIAVVVWRLYVNLDAIVARAIEDVGSDVSGTAVSVSGVKLQLLDGKAGVSGIKVANPPGFTGQTIFMLDDIALAIDVASLKKEPVIIDRLAVAQPQVFLELNEEGQSNLNVLKKNVQSYSASRATPADAEQADTPPLKFIIRKLVFEGGRVSASTTLRPDKPVITDLPPFEMTDLGKASGGASGEAIAKEILERLTQQAARAAGRAGVEAAKQELKQKAREKLDKKFDGALDGLLGK